MKRTFTIIFLISTLASFSHSDKIFREYFCEFGDEKHRIERKLNLNQDGTFTFHYYANIKAGIPQIVQKYGKGTWSVDGKVVSLFTDNEKDIDEKHTTTIPIIHCGGFSIRKSLTLSNGLVLGGKIQFASPPTCPLLRRRRPQRDHSREVSTKQGTGIFKTFNN